MVTIVRAYSEVVQPMQQQDCYCVRGVCATLGAECVWALVQLVSNV